MSRQDYQEFLTKKSIVFKPRGVEIDQLVIHEKLFPFQRDLTQWALRKGTSAIFADTGLGKTFMQLEWARLTGERTLVVAPLSVAKQTIREAKKIDLDISYARSGIGLFDSQIVTTNYEMIEHFNPKDFGAVVLDESSILKAIDGKTRRKLTEMFARTPLKLCCTATPAPNDIAEIANHSEFLGIMSRADMLAAFFVHDDNGWRLKRHAEQAFYRWLASWGMSIRKPSDLGYSDDGFVLPPLRILGRFVDVSYKRPDEIVFTGLKGIRDRHQVRRATLTERVKAAAELVDGNGDQWILWCGLNDEGRELKRLIPGSVLVEGSDDPEMKAQLIEAFQDGSARILVTKPKIAGFGLNLQNAHKMAFVGLSDSWESYYQCIRRCYRFGQSRPVDVYIVLSELERDIYENIQRKEKAANKMRRELVRHVRRYEEAEIKGVTMGWDYETETVESESYTLMLGDSVERLKEIENETVDLSVFSPPFANLYTYTPTERDVGNVKTEDDYAEHMGYVAREILRLTKPGRNCCVHVSQVPAMLVRDGYIGLKDFRGQMIRLFEGNGWTYHGEVCIDKDPQAQAIRTKSKALLFVQLHKDSSWSRPGLADYILIFRKPGENAIPISPDIDNEKWIQWARPIWYGIKESDTLQFRDARDQRDERHICPLQLETIERCVRLWSNPGDTVLDPFAGIGSTGFVAVKFGRRAICVELKRSYFEAACRNIAVAEEGLQVELDFGAGETP